MRQFRWRQHHWLGGGSMSPLFRTPEEAGRWRAEHLPDLDLPLALAAVVDGSDELPTMHELADCQYAWLLAEGAAA